MPVRILVAGIGNVFLGDDGFGVEAVRRLAARPHAEGVALQDYGIRGLDLAYALLDPYDAVIFIDAAPRGEEPGTLYVIEPDLPEDVATLDAHGMDPVKVLALARAMGAAPMQVYVVGCEPDFLPPPDSDEVVMELTQSVEAAVDEAVRMVEALIARITARQAESGEHAVCVREG